MVMLWLVWLINVLRKKHADKWNFGNSVFGGRFIPATWCAAVLADSGYTPVWQ